MFFDSYTHVSIPVRFLFNQEEYLRQHHTLYCTAYMQEYAYVCRMSEVSPGHYISGYKATFGGIEGKDPVLLDLFIQELIKQLKQRKASLFTLRQVPYCYQSEFYTACHERLLAHGFQLQVSDINQHIEVSSSKKFLDAIDGQKKRRLQKLKDAGAEFRLFDTVPNSRWYELFQQSREVKGFPVNMQQSDYDTLSKKIPDVYQYAGVYLNEELIANGVIVRVSNDVLYYFAGASDPVYNSLSPSVMLIENMYALAVSENCSMIDLGISSVDGSLNSGLHLFKKHIGAVDSAKNIYTIHF